VNRFTSSAVQEFDIELDLFDDFGGPVQVPEDHVRRVLTASDVGKFCGVATDQVLDWIDSGRLPASHIPNGRYRISTEDFLAFVDRYEIAI
jgi:hypothetical protein